MVVRADPSMVAAFARLHDHEPSSLTFPVPSPLLPSICSTHRRVYAPGIWEDLTVPPASGYLGRLRASHACRVGADSRARVLRYDGNKRISVGLSWLDHPHQFLRSRSPLIGPSPIFLQFSVTWESKRDLGAKGPVVVSYDCGEFSCRRAQCGNVITLPISDSSPGGVFALWCCTASLVSCRRAR